MGHRWQYRRPTCRSGTDFRGLSELYGNVQAGVARGLALGIEHGSQYLSNRFLNKEKSWGIKPNFAFTAEPQTNGVTESFNRTLKEQAIYNRVFGTIEDVRQAERNLLGALRQKGKRVEKNGLKSPQEIRQDWLAIRLRAY